jgi:hypothetical protein
MVQHVQCPIQCSVMPVYSLAVIHWWTPGTGLTKLYNSARVSPCRYSLYNSTRYCEEAIRDSNSGRCVDAYNMLPPVQRELARHGTLPKGTLPKDCWDVTSVEKPDSEMTALDSMEADSSLKEIPYFEAARLAIFPHC